MQPPLPRYSARLSVGVPDGAAPRELLELRRTDGSLCMTMLGFPVGAALTAADWVARERDDLVAAGESPGDAADHAGAFGGRSGLRVTVKPAEASGALSVRLYCIEHGWGYLAVAFGEPGDADAEPELLRMLATINLAGIPAAPVVDDDGPAPRSGPRTPEAPRQIPEASAWATFRQSWSEATPGRMQSAPEEVIFTAEELAAVAALVGAEAFPGVRPQLFEGWSDDARRAVMSTASRSLVARGVLGVHNDGSLFLADRWAPPFAVATQPDLMIVVNHTTGDGTQLATIAASPELAVTVRVVGPDLLGISTIPVTDILDRVFRETKLPAATAPSGEPFTTTEATIRGALFDDDAASLPVGAKAFAAAIGPTPGFTRVLCLFRRETRSAGTALDGGELTWVDTGSGCWIVEPMTVNPGSEPAVRVEPADSGTILATLLAYLPGGQPGPESGIQQN